MKSFCSLFLLLCLSSFGQGIGIVPREGTVSVTSRGLGDGVIETNMFSQNSINWIISLGVVNTNGASVGALSGDVTKPNGSLVTTIAAGHVVASMMANDLDTNVFSSSGFLHLVNLITNVATKLSTDATNSLSGVLKTYTDNATNGLSGVLKTYTDNATNGLSGVLKTYTQNSTNDLNTVLRAYIIAQINASTNDLSNNELTNKMNHGMSTNVFSQAMFDYLATLASGGSQTPWASDINANGHSLSNIVSIIGNDPTSTNIIIFSYGTSVVLQLKTNGQAVVAGPIYGLFSTAGTNANGSGLAFLEDVLNATNGLSGVLKTYTQNATNDLLATLTYTWATNLLNHRVGTNVFAQSAFDYFATLGGGGAGTLGNTNANMYNTLAGTTTFLLTNGVVLGTISPSVLTWNTNFAFAGSGPYGSAINLTNFPFGTTYYVATNGLSSNNGLSTNATWDLATAMSRAGASNTVVLLPGEYTNIYLQSVANCSYQTWKSQVKWGARIKGVSGFHGVGAIAGVTNVTVDGLEVSYSWIDGVKADNDGWTVRNCWIHNSGQGDPSWQTNGVGTWTGQGISAYGRNLLIENNLVETNGATVYHDHGIYTHGTNIVIRGNVFRYNLAYGIQVYGAYPTTSPSSDRVYIYNNLVYGNDQNFGLGQRCVTIYVDNGIGTNYVFGNTFVSTNDYALVVNGTAGGMIFATNNILVGKNSGISATSVSVQEDYNLFLATPSPTEAHQIVAASPGFANTNNGLYWLSFGSAAKSAAKNGPGLFSPVDFFGNKQVSVSDVGAFQYNSELAGDYRNLDRSATNGADYWLKPGFSQTNYTGTFGGLSSLSNAANYILAGLNDVTNTANSYSNGVAVKGITIQGSVVKIGDTTLAAGSAPFFAGDNITNLAYTVRTNSGGGNALIAGSDGTPSTCYITNITADTTFAAMTFAANKCSTIMFYASCSGGTDRKLLFPANFLGAGFMATTNMQTAGIQVVNAKGGWGEIRCVPGLITNVFWGPWSQ